MTPEPASIFDHTPESLRQWCIAREMPPFAAKQILQWVYDKHETSPQSMTNLSQRHRDLLHEQMIFTRGDIITHQRATDGTEKVLIGWKPPKVRSHHPERSLPVLGEGDECGQTADTFGGPQTESVMIPTEKRKTACISSQVGCPVGCRFCASGLGGLETNLTRGAIVEQVHHLTKITFGGRITNIVFMGMGEPLANFTPVTNAIRTLNAPWGYTIGARRITVSTVGLPQAIRKLIDFEIPVTLALSLHAPNDDLRRQLIPWAEYTTIAELMDACQQYFDKTGREITFEYLLLGGVNDQRVHATELANIAKRIRANINLIRYNEVQGLPYIRPKTDDVLAFQSKLRGSGINTHIRASRGRDIAAACGQLRHEEKQKAG